jgi:hypothetical protein
METTDRRPGKVRVVDAKRGGRSAGALAREGHETPAALPRSRHRLRVCLPLGAGSHSGPDLDAAVVAMAGGRARGRVEGLRILRPDLQILASSEPSWNAREE